MEKVRANVCTGNRSLYFFVAEVFTIFATCFFQGGNICDSSMARWHIKGWLTELNEDAGTMIQIINYGLGNLGSVQNMLKRINVNSTIVKNPKDLRAEKIILPGVGSFDTGMNNLLNEGWVEALNEKVVKDKVPTLGICLGMQLMTNRSEEGQLGGLGWIEGEVVKFSINGLKTPHMGWNIVRPAGHDASILRSEKSELRFYFVHSYFVKVNRESDQLGITNYGGEFTSAFRRDNVYGVQFHPEKSHKFGMMVFKNFASL